jgi:hypothetical protein
MLRSIKDLIGYPIDAVDGKVGKVEDALRILLFCRI